MRIRSSAFAVEPPVKSSSFASSTMDRPAVAQQTCADAEHPPPTISLTGVSKHFAGAGGEPLEVLKEINLTVAEHTIVGLLGASGSGKSTLLNIISGIIKPGRAPRSTTSNSLWRRDRCRERSAPGGRTKRCNWSI